VDAARSGHDEPDRLGDRPERMAPAVVDRRHRAHVCAGDPRLLADAQLGRVREAEPAQE
jgi:hypothetical protein